MLRTAEGHSWTIEGKSWEWALEVEAKANHWPRGPLEEEAGCSRIPAHPHPQGVADEAQRDLLNQTLVEL